MSMIIIPTNDEIIAKRNIYDRVSKLLGWDASAFEGQDFCLQLPNETLVSRNARKKLFASGFVNLSNDLISAICDAVFHQKVVLEFDDEESGTALFADNVNRSGGDKQSILTYAKDVVSVALRTYGTVFTVIDKPDYTANSFEDEIINGKPYLQNISPLNVVNWSINAGVFDWFAYNRTYSPPWEDPTVSAKQEIVQTRIWTKTELITLENGSEKSRYAHNWGFVPVVVQSFYKSPDDNGLTGQCPFFATSSMIIMANNLLSVANMELFKHGNSILLMHEEAVSSMNMQMDVHGDARSKFQDQQGLNQLVWHGTSIPQYLTKELQAVTSANQQADFYFKSAVDNERTMRSILKRGVSGIDIAESGAAKAFDAQPILASLQNTAEDLQEWTKKVLGMVSKLYAEDEEAFKCEYPSKFDVVESSTSAILDDIAKMQQSRYPSDEGLRIAWKKITPDLTADVEEQEKINEEINASVSVNPEQAIKDQVAKDMASSMTSQNMMKEGDDNDEQKEKGAE